LTSIATIDGREATSRLRAGLVRVREVVSYLKADVGSLEHSDLVGLATDGWLDCRGVIDDPAELGRVIRQSASSLGTEDQMVAASLWVQGYAYRLLTLAVACMCIEGVIPDCSPARLAIGSSRGRPSLVLYKDPAIALVLGSAGSVPDALGLPGRADLALGFVLDTAIDKHLRPLIVAVQSVVRVGERLLWGNVAASAAIAFRTLEGSVGPWVIPLGERFFELAPAELHGLGSFLLIEGPTGHGWFWERTNCCLFDRLPGKLRCSDCSRTPEAERRAAYDKSLQG
jgi:hypothetical protein